MYYSFAHDFCFLHRYSAIVNPIVNSVQKSTPALPAPDCTDSYIPIQRHLGNQVADALIRVAGSGCVRWLVPGCLFTQGISVCPPGESERTGDDRGSSSAAAAQRHTLCLPICLTREGLFEMQISALCLHRCWGIKLSKVSILLFSERERESLCKLCNHCLHTHTHTGMLLTHTPVHTDESFPSHMQ